MYSNLGKGLAWLFLGLFSYLPSAQAQEADNALSATLDTQVLFSAKPASCVALRQGRTCFAPVSLIWQAPKLGNYCIVEQDSNNTIACWNNSKSNTATFEFESKTKRVYQLIHKGEQAVIAQTSIDVSWVHKASPRKRRWRLF